MNLPIGICVDASTRPTNPGFTEYRGMDLQTNQVIFHTKIGFASNNVGEYCAIVEALCWCERNNKHVTIYSDSKIAINWIMRQRTSSGAKICKDAFELFKECENYVRKMKYVHHIKWFDKRIYGEIPADFGRK